MVRIIHFPMQDFQTIAHLIPNLGERVDDPPAPLADQNTLRGIFEELLGQSARYIQPVLFRSGRLNVYAEAAVWGQHIHHRHTTLLARCEAAGLAVTEIKVKVRPGSFRANDQTQPRPATYNTETASRQMEALSRQVNEPELKQTLSRLAARIRENHRVDSE